MLGFRKMRIKKSQNPINFKISTLNLTNFQFKISNNMKIIYNSLKVKNTISDSQHSKKNSKVFIVLSKWKKRNKNHKT